jgi:hypothetical protein
MLIDAFPLESVVPVADCEPSTKATFLPDMPFPYSSTRWAWSVIDFGRR